MATVVGVGLVAFALGSVGLLARAGSVPTSAATPASPVSVIPSAPTGRLPVTGAVQSAPRASSGAAVGTVTAQAAAGASSPGQVGLGEVVVVNSVAIAIDSVTFLDYSGVAPDARRFAVEAEVTNTSSTESLIPAIGLSCRGTEQLGTFYRDATLVPSRALQPDEQKQGVIVLGMPLDLTTEDCADPAIAVVRVGLPAVSIPIGGPLRG